MSESSLRNKKIDPSEIKQQFVNVQIKLHCCRYWLLREWEFADMAYPFWRVYYNTIEGASVGFFGKKISLDSEKIIVIPPNTSFSTSFRSKTNFGQHENVEGKRVEIGDLPLKKNICNVVDHLFIHFNLGYPFDFIKPDIYIIPKNEVLHHLLNRLKDKLVNDSNTFEFLDSILTNSIITLLLNYIPTDSWTIKEIDPRLKKVLKYIDKHLHESISNSELASEANMATNSFARYFREKTGMSLRQFIIKKRIEHSCHMMHHSSFKIDEIAEKCGFCDRQYFSRVFKEITTVSPAYYKKHLMI